MSRKPSAQARARGKEARRDSAFWKAQSKKAQSPGERSILRRQAARRLLDARKAERPKW